MQNVYNNENPLFFLFTCVKDGRAFINKLFDSLLQQSKVNFVHYIYEDGSNDPIEDLVDIYKEKNSKLSNPIQIIYEKNPKNIGLNMATKHCIDMCYLPYFLWINCDDWVHKDFFSNLEKEVTRHPDKSIFFSNMKVYENNKFHCRIGSRYLWNILKKSNFNELLLADKMVFNHFCLKLDKYKQINPENLILDKKIFFNDEQVVVPLAFKNIGFCYCKKIITYFYKRGDSEFLVNNQDETKKVILYREYFRALKFIDFESFLDLYDLLQNFKHILSNLYRNRKYNEFLSKLNEYKSILEKHKLFLKPFYYGEKPFIYWKFIVSLRKILKF